MSSSFVKYYMPPVEIKDFDAISTINYFYLAANLLD